MGLDMLIGETTKSLVGKWHAAPGVKCKGRSHGKEETEASYKAWHPGGTEETLACPRPTTDRDFLQGCISEDGGLYPYNSIRCENCVLLSFPLTLYLILLVFDRKTVFLLYPFLTHTVPIR